MCQILVLTILNVYERKFYYSNKNSSKITIDIDIYIQLDVQ